jgi:hypothetical protein
MGLGLKKGLSKLKFFANPFLDRLLKTFSLKLILCHWDKVLSHLLVFSFAFAMIPHEIDKKINFSNVL